MESLILLRPLIFFVFISICLPCIAELLPANNILALPAPIFQLQAQIDTPNNPITIAELQGQLLATQEDLKAYKREMNDRLVTLEQQNSAMQLQISHAEQMLSSLTQQMVNVSKQISTISNENNLFAQFKTILPKSKAGWWIIWGVFFSIVLLWMPWSSKKVVEHKEPMLSNSEDHEDEYDYMNSEEAIPAKLDLARTYIDMDDPNSAKQILKDVLDKGNEAEKKRAQQLLSMIKI